MRLEKGFSLVELLIVVVVIGIIVAVAIPNLLASRRASNEASAISSLRAVHSAQATYLSTFGGGEYAGNPSVDVALFNQLGNVGLVDEVLESGSKSGYGFIGAAVPASDTRPATFCASTVPLTTTGVTTTGTKNFAVATEGRILTGSALDPTTANCDFDPSGAAMIVNGLPIGE